MGRPAGRLLAIDLAARTFRAEEIDPSFTADYLGGRGLGARLITFRGAHRLDPLSPEAPIAVVTGPLTGTRAPGSGRLSMSAVSPLTGTLFDSNSGGRFGERLKGAGYDALLLTGKSEKPVAVAIDPTGVRFLEASHLWGLGNTATAKALESDPGPGYSSLTIGPAGESGSLLANICHSGRFFGRGGLGASFGAKNLKAICVAGDYSPELADPGHFRFICDECRKLIAAHPITSKGLKQFGTAVMMNVMNKMESLPVANFRAGSFDHAASISGEAIRDELLAGTHACPSCPIGCGRKVNLDGEIVHGPEFETLWSFGAALENDDLQSIARLNLLANDLGMDTISAGSTIAAARELFESGDLPFDPLSSGEEGLKILLDQMARLTGRGELLGKGSLKLALEAGGSAAVSMTVKGLELPAYDPRGCQGQGLAYATSSRGGCHLRSYMIAPEILAAPKQVDRFATSGKAGLVIVSQNLNAATDSLIMCRFMSFALKDDYYARLLRAATGLEIDAQGLMTVGERIYNLERLANIDLGFGRDADSLPARLTSENAGSGSPVELDTMLDEYYRFRGWDGDGRPSEGKLKTLGLDSALA